MEKHLVVEGAICMCNFGTTPDRLKVMTNNKEYANDSAGVQKLIASTMDVGAPFEAGTFGACAKMNGSACKSVVTEWQQFYEKTELTNGGKILLEDSKATCPVGTPGCIRIIFHGQQAEMNKQNFKKAKREISKVLNPAINLEDVLNDNSNLFEVQ